MSDVIVTDQTEQQRYVAHVDGVEAGAAQYELAEDPARIVFTHTVVGDDFEGEGVGSALARTALDDVRAAGERSVVARCSFIAGWVDKHPDYQDLLAG